MELEASKSEKDWEIDSDARSLIHASKVFKDRARLKKAIKRAQEISKEEKEQANAGAAGLSQLISKVK